MCTVNLSRHLDRATWPETSLMGSLTPSDRAALLATGTRVQFSDDDILVMQGDVGDVLYVLTGGMVKVTVSAESGIETMLAVRSRGDLIGEFSVLDGTPRASAARAVGMVGDHCDTETGAYRDGEALHVGRLRKGSPKPFSNLDGAVHGVEMSDHHGELVATYAGQKVAGAAHIVHASRDIAQDLVPDVVAEAVVDPLEAIEVNQHHRDPAALSLR